MDARPVPGEPRQGNVRSQGGEPPAGLPYTGPDTSAQLTALHVLERMAGEQVYTGPDTGTQLIALRHLEHIASEPTSTAAAALTAVAPALLDSPTLVDAPPLKRAPEPPWERTGVHRAARRRERGVVRALREVAAVPWPLYAVLAAQCVLSLHLIWANTAFLDEAIYIWAGRVQLWHATYGLHAPVYASYFSGAPSIYPPLAGIADIIGGLAAARLLSLGFMLGVTSMLWGSARSLFGLRAALGATALFTAIGSTQFLGALATYDAMGLFLLTLSVRLVIAAKDRNDSTLLLIGAIAALALANATKYATGLFDPVVIAVAVLTSPRGLKAGIGRGGLIATSTVGLIALLLAVGGPLYVVGLEFSTLTRSAGGSSPLLVLQYSTRWVGVVVLVAALAAAFAWWRDRAHAGLLTALAVAGLLVPLNQARIHTTVSLLKHVDFGAWFACIAAGYAIAVITRVSRRAWIRGASAMAVSALILLPAGAQGRAQANGFSDSWPDTTQFMAELSKLTRTHPGVYLAEDQQVPGYYLEKGISWEKWQGTWSFHYRAPGTTGCLGGTGSGLTGKTSPSSPIGRAFASAIAHHYFGLIMLSFGDTAGIDKAITGAITRYHTYQVVAEIPYTDGFGRGQFVVWAPTATEKEGLRGTSC
jgi:hypothetical protein